MPVSSQRETTRLPKNNSQRVVFHYSQDLGSYTCTHTVIHTHRQDMRKKLPASNEFGVARYNHTIYGGHYSNRQYAFELSLGNYRDLHRVGCYNSVKVPSIYQALYIFHS